MELQVLQSSVGRYNLLGHEETFEFTIGLCEDGTRSVIKEDGISAVLHYSGNKDEKDDFSDPFDNLEWVLEKCWEYAESIWSTVDYKKQCLLFARLYHDNHEAIDSCLAEKHIADTKKKIEELTKKLSWNNIIPDLSYKLNKLIERKIEKIKVNKVYQQKELTNFVEGSEKFEKAKTMIDGYDKQIETLTSQLIKESAE